MGEGTYQAWLKWSLYALSGYFFAVAAVHLFGVKIPLLFVYFNVPSYAYQDRIISFLALGWGVFILTAAQNIAASKGFVRALIIAGLLAVIWLSINNSVTDFAAIAPGLTRCAYWLQTGGLGVVVGWLYWLYKKSFS